MVDANILEVELYGYKNDKGQMLWTPNLEFARIQADKYGSERVYVEKN